jgi:hypothetical protein
MLLFRRPYMRKRRLQYGGVYLNKQRGIWYYRRTISNKRTPIPFGTLAEYPTKARAYLAAVKKGLIPAGAPKPKRTTFELAALNYMEHRMPEHPPTAGAYRNYLERYCIPRWGSMELAELAAVPLHIEKWLDGIRDRAPKTKAHIKGVMRLVFRHAPRV